MLISFNVKKERNLAFSTLRATWDALAVSTVSTSGQITAFYSETERNDVTHYTLTERNYKLTASLYAGKKLVGRIIGSTY